MRLADTFWNRETLLSESLQPKYFDDVYGASGDPWNYQTSEYEKAKYEDTIQALTRDSYESALEIGCSIGVLTARLAQRCAKLLSTDVSEKALAAARERCKELPQVTFRRMEAPKEFPSGTFDLTVLSEVAYYWSFEDLALGSEKIGQHLMPGGQLLLVHWTPFVHDYPLTGDQVHEWFLQHSGLQHLHGHVAEKYRLDLFTSS